MKINTCIFHFIVLFLICGSNCGFGSDKQGNGQGQTGSGYTKSETTKSGNQETTTYTSISKDYMSSGKCTETRERK